MNTQTENIGAADLFKRSVLEGFSLNNQNLTVPSVLVSLASAFVLGLVIYYVYKKTYRGVLYSHSFNVSLVMLTMVTAMIIMCISSNIGLTLGMVGALSIVRFRTAVKDPMDTVFMFWAIAAGITVGANYILYAIIGTLVIAVLLFLMTLLASKAGENYLLVIHHDERASKDISGVLAKVPHVKLKSRSVTRNGVETTYELRLPQQRANLADALLRVPGVFDATLVAFQNEIA